MTHWRQLTLGAVVEGAARYRPLALTLAGVLLVALGLPRNEAGDAASGAPTASLAQTRPADGSAGSSTSTADVDVAASSAAGLPRDTETRQAPGTAASAVAPPAVGRASGDPLTAPDCDASTARLRLPSAYAPNCVPVWPKGADNGGGTYQGVARDAITVAVYVGQSNAQALAIVEAAGYSPPSEEETRENRRMVFEAYQAHYETYGRTVRFVEVRGSGPADDQTAAKADAIRVASEIKAFASLGDPVQTSAYADELAARNVLCIGCTVSLPWQRYLEWDPYVWGYLYPVMEQGLFTLAEYTGKRLWGRTASHAGDPLLQSRTRKLGLLAYNTYDKSYDSAPEAFKRELAKYGARVDVSISYPFDLGQAQEQARTMIARLKDGGVTTVLMWTDPLYPVFLTKEATNQQYFPEWVGFTDLGIGTAFFSRTYDQVQWAHAFGIAPLPARVDPDVVRSEGNVVSWHLGHELSSYPSMIPVEAFFTGVHLAGPVLTPATFRAGMFAYKPVRGHLTRFAVSYGTGLWPQADFCPLDDYTEFWWDPNARGPDELGAEGLGLWRYVDMGKRYLFGQWPSSDPKVFDPANTVTIYRERPPADRLPRYEHAHHRGR